MSERKIVVIESPFSGDVLSNVAYARACLADSLKRGEAPVASHLLYTQPGVLDDDNPEERQQGMEAGWAFFQAASLVAVYTDLDISPGMKAGIERAKALGIKVEERKITGGLYWDSHEAAFPPGSTKEWDDGTIVERGSIARDIRVHAMTVLPLSARSALDTLADKIERDVL